MALSAGSILSMEAQGRLAMRWSSHGCQYGIGRSIDGSLEHGICVIVNGSREYLPEALRRYPDLLPVLVEVEPAILRQRLLARGKIWKNVCSARWHHCLPLAWSGSYASTIPVSWKRRSTAWRISCGLSCRCAVCRAPPRGRRAALPEANLLADLKKGLLPCGERALLLSISLCRTHSRRVSMRAARQRACAGQMCRKPQRLGGRAYLKLKVLL